jgi:hypothetical protein
MAVSAIVSLRSGMLTQTGFSQQQRCPFDSGAMTGSVRRSKARHIPLSFKYTASSKRRSY